MEKKRYLKIFKSQNDYDAVKKDLMGIPHVVYFEATDELLYVDEEEIDYSKEYFTIEALEDGLTVQLSRNASEYRIDNGEWIHLATNTATPSINSGQKISFKITNPTISSSYGIGTFTVNKAFNVEGNIMSLLYGDNFEGQIDLSGKNNAFRYLFQNCTTLKNAENLIIPATILANYCYNYMFSGCTSLITAPQLPATTLAYACYQYMFYGCTSLTEAPELPATTLASYCYQYMFYGCTSLTESPELLATTLADGCYQYMFNGCSKLNYIKMLATYISIRFCLMGWVTGVASSGTFVKHPDMTSLPSGTSGIPNGWTVEDDGENVDTTINVEINDSSINFLSNVEITEDSISINGENITIQNDENNNYNIIIE